MVSERKSWRSVVVQNHKWPALWADRSENEGYLLKTRKQRTAPDQSG